MQNAYGKYRQMRAMWQQSREGHLPDILIHPQLSIVYFINQLKVTIFI